MTLRRGWLLGAAVAAGVMAAALLSYALAIDGIVALWLPGGLVLGLLLRADRSRWAGILVAAWLGNAGADLLHVAHPALALAGPVANMVESLAAAWVVRTLAAGRSPIASLRGVGALVIGGAVASNAVTALVGGGLLTAFYGRGFGAHWLSWWIGDGLGMLVVAPAVLALRAGDQPSPARAVRSETLAFSLLLVLSAALVFDRPGARNPSLAAAIFALVMLAAVRLGGAVLLLPPALAIVTLWFSANGLGPLVQPGVAPLETAVQVLGFLGIATVTILVLVATLAERAAAEAQRARLQLRLQESRRLEAIGRLTGGIAHDFNNVLTIVVNHVAFARDALPPGHAVRAHLDEIGDAAQRSANLTRQLLGFAQRQAAAPRTLDLDAAIAATVGMLQRLVGEHLRLSWQPGAAGHVRIDPSQLDQILINLCANARDAAHRPGRVELRTEARPLTADERARHPDCTAARYALLTVRDDGRGMDADTLAHAFEPFFTTKAAQNGTGLGLATVHGIVRQNGGLVEITSAPAAGTSVLVGLPCRDGPTPTPDLPPPPGTDAAARPGETVLLVEDDRAVLALANHALTRLGYRVVAASRPTQALAVAEAGGADIRLLVTDVVMPEMNGRELAQRIAALHPGTRVLFVSGYPEDVIARNGVLERGVAFLPKPYAPDELAARVRAMLDAAT